MGNSLRQLFAITILLSLALLAGCGSGQSNPFSTLSSSNAPATTASGSSGTTGSGSGTTGSGSGTSGSGTSSGSAPGIPANAITISDIQKVANWENCTDCAGGALALYSMTAGISNPSLDGSTAQFSLLSGSAPWSQALWWKYLTANNSATHFVYDLYFYMDNPSAAQALEFGVSQSTGANRYEFSTQCDMQGDQTWRAWNPTIKGWTSTGAPCTTPAANAWNHLIWEFTRDSNDNVIFTAVTLNGNRSVVNTSMAHQSDSSSGIDVAFQMDARNGPTLYSVWLDKVNLYFW